jgi:hypothetical protein
MAMAAALALPANALAHDSYVDQGTGHDTGNDCSHKANPCKTLVHGLSQVGAGDTLFVNGNYTYANNGIVLENGISLVHENFVAGSTGRPVLTAGSSGNPEISVPGTVAGSNTPGAGLIKGFTIRSQYEFGAMEVDSKATVENDVFDESSQVAQDVGIGGPPSGPVGSQKFLKDRFVDPTPATGPGTNQEAIDDQSPGSPLIKGCRFKDFETAVAASDGAGGRVVDSRITGIHVANNAGVGIESIGAGTDLTIVGDSISDPGDDPANEVDNGIGLVYGGTATIDRTLVAGMREALDVNASPGVTAKLDSDAFIDSATDGIVADAGDLHATNVTVNGSGDAEILLNNSPLRLDSSLIGPGRIGFAGTASCTITHSRGPVKHSGGTGCKNFQTTQAPQLKADGYHLKGSSPLIDAGNPQDPPKGDRDIDGDRRALPGDCSHTGEPARRDIGADEFSCH